MAHESAEEHTSHYIQDGKEPDHDIEVEEPQRYHGDFT